MNWFVVDSYDRRPLQLERAAWKPPGGDELPSLIPLRAHMGSRSGSCPRLFEVLRDKYTYAALYNLVSLRHKKRSHEGCANSEGGNCIGVSTGLDFEGCHVTESCTCNSVKAQDEETLLRTWKQAGYPSCPLGLVGMGIGGSSTFSSDLNKVTRSYHTPGRMVWETRIRAIYGLPTHTTGQPHRIRGRESYSYRSSKPPF